MSRLKHPSRRPLRHPLRSGVVALALVLSAWPAAHAQTTPDRPPPPISERAPEVRLAEATVSFPIVMVREFPFIEGAISGVAGKLMLDTGYQGALTVNDHRVPIPGGRTIGTGVFGSGQTFEVRLIPELADVRVGALVFPRVTDVTTQDARLLERITPDFIGWFGYEAFATHALKLDYRTLLATFYGEGVDYLAGEQIVAELPFETRRLPNHPLMAGRIGDTPFLVSWDTGQQGALYTTEEGKTRLLRDGRLTPSAAGPEAFDLHGLRIGEHALPTITGIGVETEPSPASGPIGITEPDQVTLGYGLLRQFKTVWDFPRKRIVLLAP